MVECSLDDFVSQYNQRLNTENTGVEFKDISDTDDISSYLGDFCFVHCSYVFKDKKLYLDTKFTMNIVDEKGLVNSIINLFKDYELESVDLQLNGLVDIKGLSIINFNILSVNSRCENSPNSISDESGNKLSLMKDTVEYLNIEIAELRSELEDKDKLLRNLSNAQNDLVTKDNIIKHLNSEIDGLKSELDDTNKRARLVVKDLRCELVSKNNEIITLKGELGDLRCELASKLSEIVTSKSELDDTHKRASSIVQDLRCELVSKNNEIASINGQKVIISKQRNSLLSLIRNTCEGLTLDLFRRSNILSLFDIISWIIITIFFLSQGYNDGVVLSFFTIIFSIYDKILKASFADKLKSIMEYYINKEYEK